MKSESIKELASALAKVKFGEIGKSKSVKVQTRTGGSYSFQYAPMEVIMGAIRGPLAKEGLSLTQSVDGTVRLVVETTLIHASGEWLRSYSPVVIPEKRDAEGNVVSTTAQEMGSAISYARRYGVTLACCLVADEDDDANIADGNEVTEKKTAFAAPHKPADGAFDSLPVDMQTYINDAATEIGHICFKKDFKGAYERVEELGLDNEGKIALWSLLPSEARTGLTKYKKLLEGKP